MEIIKNYIQKSLSLFHLGKDWIENLLSRLKIAAFGNTYVETITPSQADTFHRYMKYSDENQFKRSFELCLRQSLKKLKLKKVKVALDVTEDPYWGKHGFWNTRSRVHEKSDESWQFLTLGIVEPKFVPLMSLPYKQTDNLDDLVIELLEYLETLSLKVELVLFDRGFYHWHLIDYLNARRWPYLILVPKNKKIAQLVQQTKRKISVFEHQGKYLKDRSAWKPKTKIVILKEATKNKKGGLVDWCFATNQKPSLNLVSIYMKRWNIETGFRIHDEAKIKTKSSNPKIRLFYHLLSMLYILAWRLKGQKQEIETVFKRFLLGNNYEYIIKEGPS